MTFQSALRMRGLFNGGHRLNEARIKDRFNPPCGCVAFSTNVEWSSDDPDSKFQSALRMRGLFNRAVETYNALDALTFQSALRMRGLFNQRL